MYVVWIVLAIALIAASAPLTWDRRPLSRAKALDRYSRTMNVALTPEVETVVIARLVRRERAISVGGLIGIVVAVIITVFLPGGFGSPVTVLVIAGCVLAGIGIAAAVASVSAILETDDTRPRIARASTPAFRDYVAGVERWGARVVVALGIVSIVGAFVALDVGALGETTLTAAAFVASGIPALAAVGVVSLVAVEIVARRVSGHSQRATSSTELAWDDALRATALRDLVTVPMLFGTAAVFGTFFLVGAKTDLETGGAVAAFVGLAALGVLLAGMVAVLIWSFTAKPRQHYWRRLWAESASAAAAASPTAASSATGTASA